MTMITPSYLGETIEYSSLHACRSTLEDPTSVRNLGYSRNAADFVRRYFADIGNAGGHRAMAKAVIPVGAFRAKFGNVNGDEISARLKDLVMQFLHEAPRDVKSQRSDPKPEDGKQSEPEVLKAR